MTKRGWVSAKDMDVAEGDIIRNLSKNVKPHRQSLPYLAGYFDASVDVWTGCSSCVRSEPHEPSECRETINTDSQLSEYIDDYMLRESFSAEDRIISVNWSMGTVFVYLYLRKQAHFGIGPLSNALDLAIRERLPASASLYLSVQYDVNRTCIQCGCSDMTLMRLNHQRGPRGALECYACVPKRSGERLNELVARMKGRDVTPGEDIEEVMLMIVDAAERSITAMDRASVSASVGEDSRCLQEESLARAVFYCRNQNEILKKAEVQETGPRFMRAADIMWKLSDAEREESRQEAMRLMDMARRFDGQIYDIKFSDVLAPVRFTFTWMD